MICIELVGIVDFFLFVMNFDYLLNDDIYFLFVFLFLDFIIYLYIFFVRVVLFVDDVLMFVKNKLLCIFCLMFSFGIKNEKIE